MENSSKIKELFKVITDETTLNVTNSCIDSVRTKHITKSGCRVYNGQYIGIAGTLGDETEETWNQAEKNLDLKVAYTYKPEENKTRIRNLCPDVNTDSFVKDAEELMTLLRKEFPEFIFNNKIICNKKTCVLSNDVGLRYENTDIYYLISLTVKHIDSTNIFDTAVQRISRAWELNEFLDDSRQQLNAFKNEVSLPSTEKMIVGVSGDIDMKLYEYLNGRSIGKGSSPFTSKIGQKIFSSNFTIYSDRSEEAYQIPFFDNEGSTLVDDKINFIENGVLVHPYTDKMNSDEFGYDNTASAGGDYDDVPMLSSGQFVTKDCGKNLVDIIGDNEWINIVMMSGGDCTNEGVFSSPVQLSYLMKGNKYIGKLPEFNISGNMYDYFGDDYIGTSKDRPYFGDKISLVRMNISK